MGGLASVVVLVLVNDYVREIFGANGRYGECQGNAWEWLMLW